MCQESSFFKFPLPKDLSFEDTFIFPSKNIISVGCFGLIEHLQSKKKKKHNIFSLYLNRSSTMACNRCHLQRKLSVSYQYCHQKSHLWQEPAATEFWRLRCEGVFQMEHREQWTHRQALSNTSLQDLCLHSEPSIHFFHVFGKLLDITTAI